MRIYVTHSREFDFHSELYAPLREALGRQHQLIFPHQESSEQFPSRDLFEQGCCDLVLAEVSWPSLGVGIELGWASMLNVPIRSVGREGAYISSSISAVSETIIIYSDTQDLVAKLRQNFRIESILQENINMSILTNIDNNAYKPSFEVELRSMFDKAKYDQLKEFLDDKAVFLGRDDKAVVFFALPDKFVKVVNNVTQRTPEKLQEGVNGPSD